MAKKRKSKPSTFREFELAVELCLKAIIARQPDIEPIIHPDDELRDEKKALETAFEMMNAALTIFPQDQKHAVCIFYEAKGIARVFNALPKNVDEEFH